MNKVTFDDRLQSGFVWILGYFEHGQEAALIIFHSRTHVRFYDSGQVFAQDRFLRPVAGGMIKNITHG